MSYLLLVDYSLFSVIQRMTKAQRRRFDEHLRRNQNYPANLTNFIWPDETGLLLNASVFDDMIIYFWLDDADEHIKILRIVKREIEK